MKYCYLLSTSMSQFKSAKPSFITLFQLLSIKENYSSVWEVSTACHPTPANSERVQSHSLLQQGSVRALHGWYGSARNSPTAGRIRHRGESREQHGLPATGQHTSHCWRIMCSFLEASGKLLPRGWRNLHCPSVGELMAVNKQSIITMVNKCSGPFLKLWESHYSLLSCKFLQTMLSPIPLKKSISKWKFLIKKPNKFLLPPKVYTWKNKSTIQGHSRLWIFQALTWTCEGHGCQRIHKVLKN